MTVYIWSPLYLNKKEKFQNWQAEKSILAYKRFHSILKFWKVGNKGTIQIVQMFDFFVYYNVTVHIVQPI